MLLTFAVCVMEQQQFHHDTRFGLQATPNDDSHLTAQLHHDTRPGLQPVPRGCSHLVGGGPQERVLVFCCKAAQHVADVVCAQHCGDAQAGSQQASQGAFASATGASKQHCHAGALLLDAAEHQQQGGETG